MGAHSDGDGDAGGAAAPPHTRVGHVPRPLRHRERRPVRRGDGDPRRACPQRLLAGRDGATEEPDRGAHQGGDRGRPLPEGRPDARRSTRRRRRRRRRRCHAAAAQAELGGRGPPLLPPPAPVRRQPGPGASAPCWRRPRRRSSRSASAFGWRTPTRRRSSAWHEAAAVAAAAAAAAAGEALARVSSLLVPVPRDCSQAASSRSARARRLEPAGGAEGCQPLAHVRGDAVRRADGHGSAPTSSPTRPAAPPTAQRRSRASTTAGTR